MTIDPFLAGVLATLFAELLAGAVFIGISIIDYVRHGYEDDDDYYKGGGK